MASYYRVLQQPDDTYTVQYRRAWWPFWTDLTCGYAGPTCTYRLLSDYAGPTCTYRHLSDAVHAAHEFLAPVPARVVAAGRI